MRVLPLILALVLVGCSAAPDRKPEPQEPIAQKPCEPCPEGQPVYTSKNIGHDGIRDCSCRPFPDPEQRRGLRFDSSSKDEEPSQKLDPCKVDPDFCPNCVGLIPAGCVPGSVEPSPLTSPIMPSEPEKPRGTFGSNSGSRSATERCPEGYHRVVIEHAGRARNELADLDDPPNRKRCVPVE